MNNFLINMKWMKKGIFRHWDSLENNKLGVTWHALSLGASRRGEVMSYHRHCTSSSHDYQLLKQSQFLFWYPKWDSWLWFLIEQSSNKNTIIFFLTFSKRVITCMFLVQFHACSRIVRTVRTVCASAQTARTTIFFISYILFTTP